MKSKLKIHSKNKETENRTPFYKWHKKIGFTIAGYINEENITHGSNKKQNRKNKQYS